MLVSDSERLKVGEVGGGGVGVSVDRDRGRSERVEFGEVGGVSVVGLHGVTDRSWEEGIDGWIYGRMLVRCAH